MSAERRIQVRTLKHSQVLRLKPMRDESVAWEVDENGLVRIESKHTGLVGRLLGMLLRFKAKRRIELDELGSLVWLMCDGRCTVGEIAQELIKRYKLEKRDAEISLITFIQQLMKRRLITVKVTPEIDEDANGKADSAS
ncbi:MAG: hypothetical protein GDYSWBUE_001305 [Candidatus Fervidibacterota bacterium]